MQIFLIQYVQPSYVHGYYRPNIIVYATSCNIMPTQARLEKSIGDGDV